MTIITLPETDRLRLRYIQETDAEMFYQITRDPSIQKYMPFIHQKTVEKTGAQIVQFKCNNGIYNFNIIIQEKSSGKMVGAILAFANLVSPLDLDVNILIEATSRKQGYMSEALNAFINALPKSTTFSFRIHNTNQASIRTVEKLPGIKEISCRIPGDEYRDFYLTTT